MATCVVLLRGIGPATHAKLTMTALAEGCRAAGLGLAWRDHLLGQLSPPNDTNVTIMASHPRNQRRRVLRSIDTAVLIRSRLTLRGKNGGGDAQR